MSCEHERAGDGADEVESLDEEELRAEILNCPDVLAALQKRIHADIMAALPFTVKRRIKALKKIQLEMTHIESKFYEELFKLECTYQKLYKPLFEKRGKIVTGNYEPNEEEAKWELDEEEVIKKEKEEEAEQKDDTVGIPEFWLTIFKNVGILSEMVQEHDEPILKLLEDIHVQFSDQPMGFTLQFYFSQNDYFTNTVLTKEYFMKCVPEADDPFNFEGPEIFKCKGCTIDWKEGKNVTLKTVKKKHTHESRTVKAESFFNFFSPPLLPEEGEIDEETKNTLTNDYEIGHYLQERIVPRAVLFFTGEDLEDEDYEEESEDKDDDDDEDDSESSEPKEPAV